MPFESSAAAAHPAGLPEQQTVLIIDDEPTARVALRLTTQKASALLSSEV